MLCCARAGAVSCGGAGGGEGRGDLISADLISERSGVVQSLRMMVVKALVVPALVLALAEGMADGFERDVVNADRRLLRGGGRGTLPAVVLISSCVVLS